MELSFIIIDDTELDHFIAKKMIEYAGKTSSIKSFFDGNEAIEYMVTNKPDVDTITLVFLDIYMPLMNGFEFIEAFESLDPQLQNKYYVIALTSTREPYDINRVKSHKGFKGMINKPITNEDLSVLLNTISTNYNVPLI